MQRIPTTDLFFLNACGQSVRSWFRRGAFRQLGLSSFIARDAILMLRRDTEDLMHMVRTSWKGRLLYLIDDDVEAAIHDVSLPADYRQRLTDFHNSHHAKLIERADTLIVTSTALQAKFAAHRDVRMLHPVWHLPAADDHHFRSMIAGGAIHAAHLGSGSHAEGLEFLRPVLEQLLARHDRFEFSYVGKQDSLGSLDSNPRVHRLQPQSWPRYRRWIGRQRFHLGLYPLPPTPFNDARSRNKLLEYAAVGAVGAYSANWSSAKPLHGNVILAGQDSTEWVEALSAAIRDPARLRNMMLKARGALAEINDPATQRHFWGDLFGLPLDKAA